MSWIQNMQLPSKTEFYLPPVFDFFAVFFFALTGALAGIRRSYDLIGVFAMAFVTGLGGALIRDGLFLQNGPPALTRHWGYLVAVLAGCFIGWILGSILERFKKIIAMIDALGLGAYSVVGVEKSLASGLGVVAAIFIGVTNACGGGLLRDIIVRKEPLMMKPGQFYVMASLLGSCLFVILVRDTRLTTNLCALIAIGMTFLFRMLAIAFNWRTAPMRHWYIPGKHNFAESEPLEENDET
jgi:uncharacterized membrane protein YeiH